MWLQFRIGRYIVDIKRVNRKNQTIERWVTPDGTEHVRTHTVLGGPTTPFQRRVRRLFRWLLPDIPPRGSRHIWMFCFPFPRETIDLDIYQLPRRE
ncbi:MAG TPA: hypothetical protein VH540_20020 [Ktedonobacterales bacterium]